MSVHAVAGREFGWVGVAVRVEPVPVHAASGAEPVSVYPMGRAEPASVDALSRAESVSVGSVSRTGPVALGAVRGIDSVRGVSVNALRLVEEDLRPGAASGPQ